MGETLSSCFVDASTLPDDGFGCVQLLTLGAAYGYVVVLCAQGIGDGCELLMAYSPRVASLVGPVVLPILGAVPDSMIILFSGLGEDAQEKLNVGVGALAGSSIMLLTIPWFVSILAGRVDLNEQGEGAYRSKNKNERYPGLWPLRSTGINVTSLVPKSCKVMLLTALSYLLMQIPALVLGCGYEAGNCDQGGEKDWALAALISCIVGFIGYIWYCLKASGSDDALPILMLRIERQVDAGYIDIIEASLRLLGGPSAVDEDGGAYSLIDDNRRSDVRTLLRRFWNRVDKNRDGKIGYNDFMRLLDLVNVVGEERFALMHKVGGAHVTDVVNFDKFYQYVISVITTEYALQTELVDAKLTDKQSSARGSALMGKNFSLMRLAYKVCSENDICATDPDEARKRLCEKIVPIWEMYAAARDDGGDDEADDEKDGGGRIVTLDTISVRKMFPNFGVRSADHKSFEMFLTAVDENADRRVSAQEMANFLTKCVTHYLRHPSLHAHGSDHIEAVSGADDEKREPAREDGEEEEDEVEELDVPESIAELPPDERKAAILKTSLTTIFLSTVGVILVSDPLTDVFSELGERMNISAFYVSFVLAPLASNGSELGAAYTLASRKTVAKATAGVSQLLGAGAMNNTMCLGVFLALIYFKGLRWTFTAETASIMFSEVVTALVGMKTTHTMFDAIVLISVYPLSLIMVIVMEAANIQ